MYADENVIKIKHDVLYEVAKLAFAGYAQVLPEPPLSPSGIAHGHRPAHFEQSMFQHGF